MRLNIQQNSENKSTLVPLQHVSKEAVCSVASPDHCPPFQAGHSADKIRIHECVITYIILLTFRHP